MSPAVVFYVSGHGFGHASRDIEVINALGTRLPGARVIVRTSAARWLFDLTLTRPADVQAVDCDPGVVQRDSLELDEAETLRRAAAFYGGLDRRAQQEAAVLRAVDAGLVVTDIAPLGCAAVAAAQIPAFVLANFTWDWIYAEYLAGSGGPGLLETIRSAYATAGEAWRLPMSGPLPPFRRIVDVPCIARRSLRDPGEIRRLLGLPRDGLVALASFGGFGLDGLATDALAGLHGWVILVTGLRGGPLQRRQGGLVRIDEHALYAHGLRYEDLVAAADVVVTKPGYGIVGECAANGTAVVYTSRGRFREYGVLVREMPRYLRCAYIERADLLAGRWGGTLGGVMALPPPPEQLDTDGAARVAGLIAERLTGAIPQA